MTDSTVGQKSISDGLRVRIKFMGQYGRTPLATAGLLVHVAHGHGSVLLLRLCDTLCTSAFVDDVIFSLNGPMDGSSCVFLSGDRTRQA